MARRRSEGGGVLVASVEKGELIGIPFFSADLHRSYGPRSSGVAFGFAATGRSASYEGQEGKPG